MEATMRRIQTVVRLAPRVLIIGCAHSELRQAIHAAPLDPLTPSSIRTDILNRFPIGTDFATIKAAYPSEEKETVLWLAAPWSVKANEMEIRFESQDAVPAPGSLASWIVVQMKSNEQGRLVSVEVFRRRGSL